MDAREKKVFQAKLAEQSERYDDMTKYMKEVVEMGENLSVEERNLLSVAYKNEVGAKRTSWRTITAIESKSDEGSNKKTLSKEIREKIEAELDALCGEIELLLNSKLIPATTDDEAKVFYLKMLADYYRYQAEFKVGDAKKEVENKSKTHYEMASEKATESLGPTHPIVLGLALNYSVFKFEILGDHDGATELAKTAFEKALADLDDLTGDSYKDSTLIMQLLRDNLTLWSSEQEEGKNNDEDAS